MQTYLVGGAVRDQLLGLDVTERDYVVVGSTEQEMLDLGFKPVGKDFPVFLHPKTAEEYALARTERKTGPGHQGFVCFASPDVTLEEDLTRRDLTINAIAMDADGQLVDPLAGKLDLDNRILRHVSDAFIEDPLRILRVARFKAKFAHLGFTVADTTNALQKQMIEDGVLEELTAERIHAELNKALATPDPVVFFEYLSELGGHSLWPEIDQHALDRLRVLNTSDIECRFCVLCLTLTPVEIDQLCQRLKCANLRRDLTRMIASHLEQWKQLDQLDAAGIAAFLYELDALRNAERFQRFNDMCMQISGTGPGTQWQALRDAAATVKARDIDSDIKGPALGAAIREAQTKLIAGLIA